MKLGSQDASPERIVTAMHGFKGGLHRWPRFFSDRTPPVLDILLLMIKTALVPDFRVYMVILGVDFEFIT